MIGKRIVALLCLIALSVLLFSACAGEEPLFEAHQHKYLATHVTGTCLTYGYTKYLCHCGDSYIVPDDFLGPHEYSLVPTSDVEATYSYTGIRSVKCKWCGDQIATEEVPIRIAPDLPPITPK